MGNSARVLYKPYNQLLYITDWSPRDCSSRSVLLTSWRTNQNVRRTDRINKQDSIRVFILRRRKQNGNILAISNLNEKKAQFRSERMTFMFVNLSINRRVPLHARFFPDRESAALQPEKSNLMTLVYADPRSVRWLVVARGFEFSRVSNNQSKALHGYL